MDKKVRIYTTPTCHFCKITKDWLKEHKVEYEEIDVSEDKEAMNKMIELTGQRGVPVIVIDGDYVVGYDTDELKEKLEIDD